jgi:hypothetical protein
MNEEYCKFEQSKAISDGSRKDTFRSMLFEHGHQSAWTAELLIAVMSAIGFIAFAEPLKLSVFPALSNLERHDQLMPGHLYRLSSISVTGLKP